MGCESMADADTLAVREARANQADAAGMVRRDGFAVLIRETLIDAGITDERHIANAQRELALMAKSTCLVIDRGSEGGKGTGTGCLVQSDELGFCVMTANHCVPDDAAAARTEILFGYVEDWSIEQLRSFSVELISHSPVWEDENERDRDHLDYSLLRLKHKDDDRAFLEDKVVRRTSLFNPVDWLFPVDKGILKAMHGGPKYMPLFAFSHPLSLGMRLSAGRFTRAVSTDGSHLELQLPVLEGSSGACVLFCPLTGAEYKHWWGCAHVQRRRGGGATHCMATKWAEVLDH